MMETVVTSDEYALLQAVTANPDDDLARLVYADWIEEHGRAERAEFIRLQIERDRQAATDPHARGISWREYELLRENEVDWRSEMPPLLREGISYRRGFVYRLRCSIRALIETTREYRLIDPIECLKVTVDSVDPEWMAYHPPPLSLPLAELNIDCPLSVGPLLITALIRYGPFPRLHKLSIHDQNLGDEGVTNMRLMPTSFPLLRELDLSNCNIGDRGAEELGEYEWTDQLKLLRLTNNQFNPGRVAWLRRRFGQALVL